jgi:hypothetical protein
MNLEQKKSDVVFLWTQNGAVTDGVPLLEKHYLVERIPMCTVKIKGGSEGKRLSQWVWESYKGGLLNLNFSLTFIIFKRKTCRKRNSFIGWFNTFNCVEWLASEHSLANVVSFNFQRLKNSKLAIFFKFEQVSHTIHALYHSCFVFGTQTEIL